MTYSSFDDIERKVWQAYSDAVRMTGLDNQQERIKHLEANYRGKEFTIYPNERIYPAMSPLGLALTVYRQRTARLFGQNVEQKPTPMFSGPINWAKRAIAMDKPVSQTSMPMVLPRDAQRVVIDTGVQEFTPEPRYSHAVGNLAQIALVNSELRALLVVPESNKAVVATLIGPYDNAIAAHSYLG